MAAEHDPAAELARIRRLRDLFLADRGGRALADYWRDERDLAAYDAFLGARIGFKWDAALAQCRERGWPRDDDAVVLDFGCGAGIAARRFARAFGAAEVLCHDRSDRAMAFACRRIEDEVPDVQVRPAVRVDDLEPDVLLVSHVFSELDARGEARLERQIARSRRVLIVEAGTREVGRRLARLRDRLLDRMHVLAPCPAAPRCPALADERDWCHFFATPPAEVFTDGTWVRTARALGVDLRSLPYSFLALGRDPFGEPVLARPLGRARLSKHSAEVRICTPHGLSTCIVDKRRDPAAFRALKKAPEKLHDVSQMQTDRAMGAPPKHCDSVPAQRRPRK